MSVSIKQHPPPTPLTVEDDLYRLVGGNQVCGVKPLVKRAAGKTSLARYAFPNFSRKKPFMRRRNSHSSSIPPPPPLDSCCALPASSLSNATRLFPAIRSARSCCAASVSMLVYSTAPREGSQPWRNRTLAHVTRHTHTQLALIDHKYDFVLTVSGARKKKVDNMLPAPE
jgi:hypothetical protein